MKRSVRIGCGIVVLILILAYLNSYFQLFAINFFCKSPENKFFRIMTYNINAVTKETFTDDYKRKLIDEIDKINPNILCIQELSAENFELINRSLDSIFGYNKTFGNTEEVMRFIIYSRKPLRNFARNKCIGSIDTKDFSEANYNELDGIRKQMPAYSADIEVEPGKYITVFSCHLRSNAYSTARRSMDADERWIDGLSLYYLNYKIGKRIRDYEADNVRSYVNSLQALGRPVIVAGDLNDWSGSYCLNTLQGETLKNVWWEGGRGFGFTYYGWGLKLRLDHILYSNEFELVNVFVPESNLSDHNALVADFKLK